LLHRWGQDSSGLLKRLKLAGSRYLGLLRLLVRFLSLFNRVSLQIPSLLRQERRATFRRGNFTVSDLSCDKHLADTVREHAGLSRPALVKPTVTGELCKRGKHALPTVVQWVVVDVTRI